MNRHYLAITAKQTAPHKGVRLLFHGRTTMKTIGHDALLLGGWLALCAASGAAITVVVQALA
jgi:hypothetical protein